MEAAIAAFFDWLSNFGNGAKGFLLVGMVLAAFVVAWCLPKMFKDFLDYRKSTRELDRDTKKLDLEIMKRWRK